MRTDTLRAIILTLVLAALASCTSQNQVILPPPGSVVAQNVYYATFDTTPSPQLGVVPYPLTNASTVSVTINSSVSNQLNGAASLQVDSSGRLWTISDNPTPSTIQVFTLPLTPSSVPVVNLSLTGTLNAFDFVFDKSGNGWVTDTIGSGKVYEYNGPFTTSGPISPNLTLSSNLSSPEGLAFDAAGDLFVANRASSGTNSITFFTAPITNGMASSGFLQGISGPRGLAFDSAGNLYVGTGPTPTVQRYNSNNLSNGATPNIVDSTGILGGVNIYQMQFDSAGNLYVPTCAGTPGNARLYVFPLATQPFSSTLAPSVSYTDANIQNQNCVSGEVIH